MIWMPPLADVACSMPQTVLTRPLETADPAVVNTSLLRRLTGHSEEEWTVDYLEHCKFLELSIHTEMRGSPWFEGMIPQGILTR
jgi:hypothetical protein